MQCSQVMLAPIPRDLSDLTFSPMQWSLHCDAATSQLLDQLNGLSFLHRYFIAHYPSLSLFLCSSGLFLELLIHPT